MWARAEVLTYILYDIIWHSTRNAASRQGTLKMFSPRLCSSLKHWLWLLTSKFLKQNSSSEKLNIVVSYIDLPHSPLPPIFPPLTWSTSVLACCAFMKLNESSSWTNQLEWSMLEYFLFTCQLLSSCVNNNKRRKTERKPASQWEMFSGKGWKKWEAFNPALNKEMLKAQWILYHCC